MPIKRELQSPKSQSVTIEKGAESREHYYGCMLTYE